MNDKSNDISFVETKVSLIVIVLLSSVIVFATIPMLLRPVAKKNYIKSSITLVDFFDAIKQIETGGSNNPANAIGDNGKSLGPYQISRAYWKDANAGKKYENVKDSFFAEKTMIYYWMRYCPEDFKNNDWEVLARIHNGGPRGFIKKSTKPYWDKVHALLVND